MSVARLRAMDPVNEIAYRKRVRADYDAEGAKLGFAPGTWTPPPDTLINGDEFGLGPPKFKAQLTEVRKRCPSR